MNDIFLLRPELLWLLLLLLPFALLGAARLAGLTRGRRFAALLFETLAVALLIGALAEPVRSTPDPGMSVVAVLDASNSVSPSSRAMTQQYVRELLAAAGPNDKLQFVAFAGNAVVVPTDVASSGQWTVGSGSGITETAPTPLTTTTATTGTIQLQLAEGQSDLAAGLRLAGSLLADSGRRRVVLLSDGWETQGNAESEAQRLAGRGIDLQVVSLTALGQPEVIVKYLATTAYARMGDTIRSDLRIYSTQATSATLQISVDGGQPANRRISLAAGENQVPLDQRATTEGYHQITVNVLSPNDSAQENNSASSATVVKPAPRVLVLEDRKGESRDLVRALDAPDLQVFVVPSSSVPAQVGQLDNYDAIILDNVAATSMTLDQQRTLQEYVRRNGKGLVVLGGSTAYARGGYLDSALEEMLPVSSEPAPRPEQGSTALILVLDHSFSMTEEEDLDGNNKLTMAREAAALAVDALRRGDYLGVLSFDTVNEWTVPFSVITDDSYKDRAKRAIRQIEAGGGTKIYQALAEAEAALRRSNAQSKHLVLLTDGKDTAQADYGPLLNDMRSRGISLSTIGIGRDVDKDLLTDLATRGQGRYYFTERIDNIPKIVFKELDLALKESQVEGLVIPQPVAPSPILYGFRPQDVPDLQGYDVTTAKDEAVVALRSDQGDPLLAHWNYGLGRVVAFTSDAGQNWGAGWLEWPDYSRFWNNAIRWSMASPVNRYLQPSVSVTEQNGAPVAQIAVESLQPGDTFVDLADVTAALRAPSGVVTSTLLAQTAPGRYEASVPLSEAGAYEVRLQRAKDGLTTAETIGFSVPPSAELLNAGSNDRLLKLLAANQTYQTTPAQALDPTGLSGSAPEADELWPYLLAPALVLLLLSVAARRIDFRRRRRA